MLASPTRPFVRSMLGEQANSQHRSTPSAGFGTERRPGAGGDKRYLGKFQQEANYGTQSPGPVYAPSASAYALPSAPAHSFGSAHRHTRAHEGPDVGEGTARPDEVPFPGPGKYATPGAMGTQHDSRRATHATWGFGTSRRSDYDKVFISTEHAKSQVEFVDSPGPANYRHSGSSVGEQLESTRRSNTAGATMGTSGRFFKPKRDGPHQTPGPGTYSLGALGAEAGPQPCARFTSPRKHAFPRSTRQQCGEKQYIGPNQAGQFWGRGSPGPASYGATGAVGMQISSSKRSAPRGSFGTASRFIEYDIAAKIRQGPGPGRYNI